MLNVHMIYIDYHPKTVLWTMWWQPDQLSPTWLLPPLRRNRWCRRTWQFRSSERDWRCQLRRILATLSTWKTPNGQGEITTNIHSVLVQNSFKDVQWTSSFLQRLLTINLFNNIPKYQARFFFYPTQAPWVRSCAPLGQPKKHTNQREATSIYKAMKRIRSHVQVAGAGP